MRPGSEVYAKENGSFGIATLQSRHVAVHGDRVHFDYMGKSGKRQVRELHDRRVARIVRELKEMRGARSSSTATARASWSRSTGR